MVWNSIPCDSTIRRQSGRGLVAWRCMDGPSVGVRGPATLRVPVRGDQPPMPAATCPVEPKPPKCGAATEGATPPARPAVAGTTTTPPGREERKCTPECPPYEPDVAGAAFGSCSSSL